jgi:hypothetical protein
VAKREGKGVMGNTRENRFTVHQRLAASEARLTTLEAENKQLRQWVLGELTSKINDAKNVIQDSIRVPQDGKDGRDGAQGATGAQGPAGDITVYGPEELQAAVKDLRRKYLEAHAKALAVIDQHIDHESKNSGGIHRMFQQRLESIKRDIERL